MNALATPHRFRSHASRPQRTLAPLRLVNATEHRQTNPMAQNVQCPTCSKTFMGSAVVTDDPPAFSSTHGQHVAFRRFFCDHCNHIVCWRQASNAAATRFGDVISGPGVLRDAQAVDKFLRAYPETAGVLQG